MSRVELRSGNFAWVDLMSPDFEGASAFYTGLFGWEARDVDTSDGRPYRTFHLGEDLVAGLGEAPPGMLPKGAPPMWTSYILVDDVEATTTRVAELGGSVGMGPMDVGSAGRMSVIRDPTGGTVALWEAKELAGATLFNEPNTLAWNELITKEPLTARAFYGDLLGWGWQETEMESIGTYHIGMVGERPNAGICNPPDVPDDVPPYWDVYFSVADVDAAVARVEELGGTVLVRPMEIAVGRWAAVRDPQGTHFSLFRAHGTGEM